MMAFDDSIVQEYLAECGEHLNGIETDLLAMEQEGAEINDERVNRIFRAAHSIKGGAGFFSFTRIRDLAHKTENVLDLIRSRRLVASAEVVNVLLLAFDQLRGMIENPAAGEQADVSEFVRGLEALAASSLAPEEKERTSRGIAISVAGRKTRATLTEFDFTAARKCGKLVYLIEYDLVHDIQRKGKTPVHLLKELMQYGTLLDTAFHLERAGTLEEETTSTLPVEVVYASGLDVDLIGTVADAPADRIWKVERSGVCRALKEDPAPPAPAGEARKQNEAPAPETTIAGGAPSATPTRPVATTDSKTVEKDSGGVAIPGGTADSTVRLNVAVLDSLMNLAGELVLCRNQLGEAVARGDQATIQAANQSISVVTSEVQQAVMRTRMQPVGNLFQKFTRFVRDTARKLGKEVRLVVEGNEVDLDKSILEGLSDPLSHMVRNAVDHGIEPAEERERAGKPREGTVFLRAWHEAGLVVVEVADDGRGLDPEKLAASVVAKGLLPAETVHRMAVEAKLDLILLPGFSTAERVTDVSGRGVGMDVVRTNLDRLGGNLEIHSTVGQGSSFRIKMPLTLAIIPSLLVSAGEERVAVPLVNVQKLIRITAGEAAARIERVGNAQVLVLHDSLLPLVDLRCSLDVPVTGAGAEDKNEAKNIVLVCAGGYRFGLAVERLHDTLEIVVKPLGQRLKHLRQYAGATILGDGCVALILDIAGIAGTAGLMPDDRSASQASSAVTATTAESHHLLLVHNSPEETCALPLHVVGRVEKIGPEQVEFVGGRRSMQYRGHSLPLIALADRAPVKELALDENLIVVVLEISGRQIGLIAARPVDAVEAEIEIDGYTLRQPGIMGSAILRGRTTLVLDPFELSDSTLLDRNDLARKEKTAASVGTTILFAEDSAFFREHTTKLLETEGYTVLPAPDGQAAWEMLNEHAPEIQLVLTDVEMPRLDGLQLTQRIRGDRRVARLPVIMLTSLADEEDIRRGEAAGATRYCVKLDRDQVLEAIREALAGRDGGEACGLVALAKQVDQGAGALSMPPCPIAEGEKR